MGFYSSMNRPSQAGILRRRPGANPLASQTQEMANNPIYGQSSPFQPMAMPGAIAGPEPAPEPPSNGYFTDPNYNIPMGMTMPGFGPGEPGSMGANYLGSAFRGQGIPSIAGPEPTPQSPAFSNTPMSGSNAELGSPGNYFPVAGMTMPGFGPGELGSMGVVSRGQGIPMEAGPEPIPQSPAFSGGLRPAPTNYRPPRTSILRRRMR